MEIRVDGTELYRILEGMRDRAGALSRCLPVIAEMLVAGVMDVYEAEGPGWDDLAESTKLGRRGESYKILQDTGAMAASTGGSSGADYAEAAAGVAYADFHSTGTRHMPRRDPFDLGPLLDGILEEAADLLLQEVIG